MIRQLSSILRTINLWIGKITSWSTLFMALLMVSIIILRSLFHYGSIALQESIDYLHATLIIGGMAYTYQNHKHVRVDVFFERFSPKTQRWISILTHLGLTIPVSCALIYFIYHYALQSWQIGEGSREVGGLPFLYLIKMGLLAMPILLLMDALSQLLEYLEARL